MRAPFGNRVHLCPVPQALVELAAPVTLPPVEPGSIRNLFSSSLGRNSRKVRWIKASGDGASIACAKEEVCNHEPNLNRHDHHVELALLFPKSAAARDHMTRIERGTILPVRVTQAIEVNREDDGVYAGTVDEDIDGVNGNRGIPRGSQVDLKVRRATDDQLVLDVEAIRIHGVRYVVFTDPNHFEQDHTLTAAIVGTVAVNQVRGPVVMVQSDTVINFQIELPLAG